MKQNRMILTVLGIVLAAGMILVLSGCPTPEEEESVSIPERIDAWENAINNGGDSAGANLHTTAAKYTQAQAATYWQVYFPTDSGQKYTVGNPTASGTDYTASISGGTYASGDTLTFTMLEGDSDVWMIKKIVGPSGTIVD